MEQYERYFNMGTSGITVAQKTNDKARMALSSFIHALHETESYAVARIVVKDGKGPQLLLLAPSIEPSLESLIDVPLPFAEDVRLYRFPPLDTVVTISGATLIKHRFLPTVDLTDAMSAFVDSMDLSNFGLDDEGYVLALQFNKTLLTLERSHTEYMHIDDTYSPLLHRLNQAIKRRAVRPDEPVQPPAEILIKFSHPPEELVAKSRNKLNELIAAADVKKGKHLALIVAVSL